MRVREVTRPPPSRRRFAPPQDEGSSGIEFAWMDGSSPSMTAGDERTRQRARPAPLNARPEARRPHPDAPPPLILRLSKDEGQRGDAASSFETALRASSG